MLRNRLIVLGLFVLSLVAISFYGGPVTYGAFFLSLLIPIASAAYAFLVYNRFRIYQVIVSKNVVVGTPTDFYFTLQNEDSYSFSGVKVEFFSDFSYINDVEENYEYELTPHSGTKKETVLICKYRGEYEVGIKNVIVEDYLRLFRFKFKNRETLKAIVYPRLEILDSLSGVDSLVYSNESNRNPEELDVLVREYVPGDDIRNINWKVSAHLGKPYVRGRIGTQTQSIGIIMDSCRYYPDPEEFLPLENKILEVSIAITHYYLSKGISASIQTFEGAPKKYILQGVSSFEDFYSSMAEFSFRPDNTLANLFEGVRHSDVTSSNLIFLVVHEITGDVLSLAEALGRNGKNTIIYHVTDTDIDVSEINVGKSTEYKRIGYEDRLKEVL